jgi:hypothetical protein
MPDRDVVILVAAGDVKRIAEPRDVAGNFIALIN